MNCLRCGRETVAENVFCEDCQLEMQKYPVDPGIAVQLPRRRDSASHKKQPKKHVPTAEEKLPVLQQTMRYLLLFLIICIAAILLMLKPTLHYLQDEHFEIGQNYSSVSQTETTETTPQ